MAEERTGAPKLKKEDTLQILRHVLERAWPVDRKPVFGGLVRAIDKFDREQRRRRQHRDPTNRSD